MESGFPPCADPLARVLPSWIYLTVITDMFYTLRGLGELGKKEKFIC